MREGLVETKLGQYIHINTGKLDVNAASEFGKYPFFTCSRETYRIDEAAFEGESVLVAGNGDLNVSIFDSYREENIFDGSVAELVNFCNVTEEV